MRAVIQRVRQASVTVDGRIVASIERGLLALVGVEPADDRAAAETLARKIIELRIFDDDQGKMNRSLVDVGGALLAVSQFTLLGDCRRGRRPSFTAAAAPEQARPLYEAFLAAAATAVPTAEGVFGADMQVALINEGPVTLLLDTRKQF